MIFSHFQLYSRKIVDVVNEEFSGVLKELISTYIGKYPVIVTFNRFLWLLWRSADPMARQFSDVPVHQCVSPLSCQFVNTITLNIFHVRLQCSINSQREDL